MAIRYEIDLPVLAPDGSVYPSDLLEHALEELGEEFGIVSTYSIYRPMAVKSAEPVHVEWVRFWFDPRDVQDTHEWIARWRKSVLAPRYRGIELSVVWFHPTQ